MSAKHTSNYNLCQWAPSDPVVRVDFNEDNAKIDAALASIAKTANTANTAAQSAYSPNQKPFAFGTYVGNGTAAQTISVGFKPSAVLVMPADALMSPVVGTGYHGTAAALATTQRNAILEGQPVLFLVTTGFVVYCTQQGNYRIETNTSGKTYLYIAFR